MGMQRHSHLCSRTAAVVLAFAASLAYGSAEQMISGVVRDAAGRGVADAQITLKGTEEPRQQQTTTNADGTFVLNWDTPGLYRISVHKTGFRDSTQPIRLPLKAGSVLVLVLAGTPSAAGTTRAENAMEFNDKPDFTIAGITDWTAAGGHGSDVNLRASEALARDTQSFGATRKARASNPELERSLRTAALKEPASFQANHALGAFCLDQRHFAEAIAPLEQAHKLNADDFENSFQLAQAYEGAGRHEKARSLVQRLAKEKDRAELHELLGDIEEALNSPLAAEREYERAFQIDPNEQNYFKWGSELLLHRAVQPAIDIFTNGARAFPRSERMLAALGAALYASGAYDSAARRVCEASDLNPSDPQPYLFLGKMEEAAPENLSCAEEKLARFAHSQPDNALANYYYALALTREDANHAGQAEAVLQRAVRLDPKLAEAHLQLGVLQAQRSDWESAKASYERAIAANAGFPDPHFRLAQIYKRAGDKQKALDELRSFESLKQSEAAHVEQRRREIRQFVVVLQKQSDPSKH